MKVLKNVVALLLHMLVIEHTHSNQFMSVTIQKCFGTSNPKYNNVSVHCRPLNRTSKRNSMDFYFRPGVKLEAPIDIEVIAYKKFRTVYRPHMLKLKAELCVQLTSTDHPFFGFFYRNWKLQINGNMLDPCPLSGHRYVKPYASRYDNYPLVPVGEWKVEFIITKNINNSNEFILSWTNFYEVKPTGAEEF